MNAALILTAGRRHPGVAHWGHAIPDGPDVTMRSFVFGEDA